MDRGQKLMEMYALEFEKLEATRLEMGKQIKYKITNKQPKATSISMTLNAQIITFMFHHFLTVLIKRVFRTLHQCSAALFHTVAVACWPKKNVPFDFSNYPLTTLFPLGVVYHFSV